MIAAAALGAAITYGVVAITPVAVSSGAPQIATLEPDPLSVVPAGWFGAGASSAAYEFYGMTIFETASGMYGYGGECFTAVLSADIPIEEETDRSSWSTSGPVYSGCRLGAFPATFSMSVDANSPLELRNRFPDAALQFVKDGDRIGVFLDEDPND